MSGQQTRSVPGPFVRVPLSLGGILGFMGLSRGIAVLTLILAAGISGCAATRPQTPPRPSPPIAVVTPPPDGVLLRNLGFSNGPDGFSLPVGCVIIERVDQPNVVSLVVQEPDASRVAEYLRKSLPTLGFTISEDRNGSLLFADKHFDGAFTSSGEISGLALRLVR